jgi:polyribonucleotide nucleotidyltransferase
LSAERVNSVEDVVKIGQKVEVRVTEIDDQGRVNLAIKGVERNKESDHGRGGNDGNFERKRFGGFDRKQGGRRNPKRY